ncbi:hypothetical protein TNCV_2715581 [Trichonephila clavipes]|nr:hypothetical protein TNCV_2715581 [Trichonephila clavipes]
MEIPLRTAYGQAGRCGMQPKPSSLRAQAHQSTCLGRRWAEKEKKWKLQRAYHRLASHERIISALERVKTEKRSTMEKEK